MEEQKDWRKNQWGPGSEEFEKYQPKNNAYVQKYLAGKVDLERFMAKAPEEKEDEWSDELNFAALNEGYIESGVGATIVEDCNLADSAERLAANKLVMEGYVKFQNKERGWFFSPNPNLVSATSSPSEAITSWKDWKKLNWKQQRVLSNLSGESSENIEKSDSNLEKVIKASKVWKRNLYAVFWSIPEGYDTEAYTCNIFVGDSLFLCGKNIINAENKYYSAKQIFNAVAPFTLIDKKNVRRGHIAAFQGVHLEIVTNVYMEKNLILSDEKVFSSRGGGRAASEMGTVKSGTAWFETDRVVNSSEWHFLTV